MCMKCGKSTTGKGELCHCRQDKIDKCPKHEYLHFKGVPVSNPLAVCKHCWHQVRKIDVIDWHYE